ncbi:response regulator transcription factor [Paracoccus litorisediminis]|jgi:two-component system OmpR family response regulator|uniref:Response regulator n=1 Tax=Paracoccus litorisediminis TaxID=2006130 RepID=A0A844HY48_9RHOB|nr:response regulator transcription factor [Paracoccus litorisediminis]MTH62401.1 response regulator [Paracoccus litorisediminis]
MRVLLVEDTPDLADGVSRYLGASGHAVDVAPSLADAKAALDVAAYDVMLLDLGLPDGSGLTLLRALRARGERLPVVIATARDQVSDRIDGLDAGADDYVVKPFDLGEVEARLRAHVRRAGGDPSGQITLGEFRVDRAGARLFRGTDEVRLTSREWAVLDTLVSARGRVMSRKALEERLYSFGDEIEGNAVEVYVSRLRSKLGADLIETRRGMGYLVK